MATITSVKSGYWSSSDTWDTGVPTNGDTVIIAEGQYVIFDVDQSGFANGLAALTINGIMHFRYSIPTYLKMNGNITGSGALIVGYIAVRPAAYYLKVDGYDNVYGSSPDMINIAGQLLTSHWESVYEDIDEPYIEVFTLEDCDALPGSFMKYITPETGGEGYYVHALSSEAPPDLYEVNSIQKPPAGSESLCQIVLNSTATVTIPTIRMYGWYPTREYTTLSANANSGQNQIVLTEDLGLQEGNIIYIGSGTEYGNSAESAACKYTVQSYVAETKTVTLSANLGTNRLEGDYVAWYSRPIKINRTSGTTALYPAVPNGVDINPFIAVGTDFRVRVLTQGATRYNTARLKHVTTYSTYSFLGEDGYAEDSFINTAIFTYGGGNRMERCITIHGLYWSMYSCNLTIIDCIMQNSICLNTTSDASGVVYKNVIAKNCNAILYGGGVFVDCSIEGKANNALILTNSLQNFKAINSSFDLKDSTNIEWFVGSFHNCLFETEITTNTRFKSGSRRPNEVVESFDHNQIVGNYKAWLKGGTIKKVVEV